jgi:hypothetical protein
LYFKVLGSYKIEAKMSISTQLKQAERYALRLAIFQDGLWDVTLGLIFVLLSLYPVLRRLLGPALNLLAFLIEMGVVIAAVSLLRSRLTAPRLGLIRMGASQKSRLRSVRLAGAGLMVFTGLIFALASIGRLREPAWSGLPAWLATFDMDILFATLIIMFFSLMGIVFGLGRLYLYGWLVGLGNLASTVLEVTCGMLFLYPLALTATLIVLIGITQLVGFLRRYPQRLAEG